MRNVRRHLLITGLLLAPLGAATAPRDPDAAYQHVRACYHQLQQAAKPSAAAYAQCAEQFVQIAKQFPDHPRAVEGLYSSGLVYELQYQRTKDPAALTLALKHYRRIAARYDTHRLADDALLRRAQLYAGGLDKPGAAKRLLQRLVRWYPDGDQRPAAQALYNKLAAGGHFTLPAASPAITAPPPPRPLAGATPAVPATRPEPAAAPPIPAAGTSTLAGLRIAVDAGHGGTDPGAKGPTGILEKTVTLQIANALARHLRAEYGCIVTLTRTADRAVSLGERNRIANTAHADLFVSIHANAATNTSAHGTQTYYLNNATDQASRRLAARENAAAGTNLSELDNIVSTMLQNAYTEDSAALAGAVQRSVVGRLAKKYPRVTDQKVHSALFYVLVGAKSPAILVETAFISNPEEEQRLQNAAFQVELAAGIARGIATFQTTRRAGNL